MSKTCGGTGEMGRRGGDQPGIAGRLADLGRGGLLHGIDQAHEPAPVESTGPADLKSRCLKLSWHLTRIFPERRQLGNHPVVPATMPQRKCGACDLLHRGPFRSVVVVRNDERNAPDDVGPAARYRDRLRPDRNRRGGCPHRTRLPHSGLRNRRRHPPHHWMGPPAPEKVQAASTFSPRHR
jgi:hypothetical protein